MKLNKKEEAICKALAHNDLTFTELKKRFVYKSGSLKKKEINMSGPTLSKYLSNLEKNGIIEKIEGDSKDKRSHKWHLKYREEIIAKNAKPFILYRHLLNSIFKIELNSSSPEESIKKIEQLLGKLLLYIIISYEHNKNTVIFQQTLIYLNEFFNYSPYDRFKIYFRNNYDFINDEEYLKGFMNIKRILDLPENIIKEKPKDEIYTNIENDIEIEEEIFDIEMTNITYLFSWNNVPGNESVKLLKYLRDNLDIKWVENLEFFKSNNDRNIEIQNDENYVKIVIDEKEEKATLEINEKSIYDKEINNRRSYDLIVKRENDKLNVYIFDIIQEFIKSLEYDLHRYHNWLMSENDKEDDINNLFKLYKKIGFPAYDMFKQRAIEIEDELKNSLKYQELQLDKENRKKLL